MNVWKTLIGDPSNNDAAIKHIFDHIRNLGICAAVGAAAVWRHKHVEGDPYWLFGWFTIGLLVATAMWLFMLNQAHGIRLMRQAGWSKNAVLAFGHFYNLIAVTIVISLVIR